MPGMVLPIISGCARTLLSSRLPKRSANTGGSSVEQIQDFNLICCKFFRLGSALSGVNKTAVMDG